MVPRQRKDWEGSRPGVTTGAPPSSPSALSSGGAGWGWAGSPATSRTSQPFDRDAARGGAAAAAGTRVRSAAQANAPLMRPVTHL